MKIILELTEVLMLQTINRKPIEIMSFSKLPKDQLDAAQSLRRAGLIHSPIYETPMYRSDQGLAADIQIKRAWTVTELGKQVLKENLPITGNGMDKEVMPEHRRVGNNYNRGWRR